MFEVVCEVELVVYMSQLAKVTKGMLCFGDSRRRRTGLIYLEDGKTPCNDVYCEEGMVVKVGG